MVESWINKGDFSPGSQPLRSSQGVQGAGTKFSRVWCANGLSWNDRDSFYPSKKPPCPLPSITPRDYFTF